ncbi:hypothetical protein JCM15519_17280 [Fundidesulfovibrio butyratiphilus]
MGGRIGPKPHDAPNYECPVCQKKIVAGEYSTLVELFPADEEQNERKAQGRSYIAIMCEVHWDCVPEFARDGNGHH